MALGQPVSDARIDLASKGVRFATAIDNTVLTRNKRPRTEEKISALDLEADAQIVANERLALLSPCRHIYRIQVRGQRFLRERGETITLQFPRFGLESGKPALVLSIDEGDSTDDAVMTVLV